MTFGEILKELQQGRVVRRKIYRPELVIFMQVPAYIDNERTWNMQSLPTDMKVILKQQKTHIHYIDQFIMYDFGNYTATYAVFDGEDINATDWEVIDAFNYKYE